MATLTSSPAASPARTSASPARARGSPAFAAGSGPRCAVSFAYFDRVSSSWRTSQLCLDEEWESFSATWPTWGLMLNGAAYRRPPLVPRTFARGCLLWPTPTASMGERGGRGDLYAIARGQPNRHCGFKFFPTLTVNDARSSTMPQSQLERRSLIGFIMQEGTLLSTPIASRRGQRKKKGTNKKGGGRSLSEDVGKLGDRGALNPPWVEWLMGFPIGWTDLEESVTPSSPR